MSCDRPSTPSNSIREKTASGVSATWSTVGPNPSQVLRYMRSLGRVRRSAFWAITTCTCWRWLPAIPSTRTNGSLDDVLHAPDRDELLHWLRHRPLLHHDPALDFLMLHAGLPPQWDLATAKACAGEVEQVLRGDAHHDYFMQMYGNKPRPLG